MKYQIHNFPQLDDLSEIPNPLFSTIRWFKWKIQIIFSTIRSFNWSTESSFFPQLDDLSETPRLYLQQLDDLTKLSDHIFKN